MRLHRLEVTAFGPFAGTETVDFETLNEAGLFLLSGATGAGKTSILDAVCFALYGTVPGVRGVKALKSQHAGDLDRPETVLDFSVRGRRFVLRRSPEWSRPKKRGTGTATEKAAASLAEVVDGEERFLTSRAAEVGLQVSTLIGMQAVQFQQVAMLPQGEFQRFLQASSQDRHDVLQHLFQTDRFSRIESWVQERSRELREQSSQREQAAQRVVDAIAERSGTQLPDALHPEHLAASVGDGAVEPWADALLADARRSLDVATTAHRTAAAAQTGARTRLEAARLRLRLHERRRSARDEQAALEASEPEAARAEQLLDADARSAACLPMLELVDRADAELRTAVRRRQELSAGLRPLAGLADAPVEEPAVDDPGSLRRAAQAVEALLHEVRALLPRSRRLLEDRAAVDALQARLEALVQEQEELATAVGLLPAERESLRHQLEAATAEAARREAVTLQLEAAAVRLRAVESLPATLAASTEAEDRVREARDRAADARDLVQDLTERRLAGMAAELAADLVDGSPCHVCGSPEHPAPASAGEQAVDKAEQQRAASGYEEAHRAHLDAVERAGAAARKASALLDAAAGGDLETCAAEVSDLRDRLAAASAAEQTAVELARRLAAVETRLAEDSGRLATVTTDVATTRQEHITRAAAVADAETAVEAVLGEGSDPAELPRLERRLQEHIEALEELRAATDQVHRAQAHLRGLEQQAAETIAAHGFTSVPAARSSALAEPERDRLAALVSERAEALARVRAVLRDAEIAGVDDGPPPDLAAAEADVASAEVAAGAAARDYHQQEQAVEALGDLRARLDDALAAWEPLRASSARAESMSKLVRGMGSDNHLQMRLSAYVLARRLDQVLDAANERLAHMRDQRYLLQRTGRATRRSSQAGLGLEVLDQWTGDVRDPATLSGGETFVVSLALALGLADVVTHEAGGTEIETLFVDEGFGTLDPDTLDDVMDRLDGLRAGGRTVGVVSHVSELRTRIPHQVHVHKSPRGSSVSMSTAVG